MSKDFFQKGISLGFGFSLCVLAVGMVTALLADAVHNFSSGELVSSSQLNANFNKLPPIGSIQAWDNSITGVPSLPDGWVQCDGQTLSDSESPLNGQVIPNLNAARNAWNSKGSFLRGGSTAGVFEDDAFQGHYHRAEKDSNIHEWYLSAGGFALLGGGNDVSRNGATTTQYRAREAITDGTNGAPRYGMETTPVNMSVIWIMRVK